MEEAGLFAPPEGGLAVLLIVSQLLYLVTVLTLGTRLLLLSKRTRQLPEALLASHFVLCAGIGYLLLVIGHPAAYQPGLLPARAIAPLIGAGHFLSCLGVFAGACFNRLVFRRSETWSRALVWLSALTMSAGFLGYWLNGGFSHGRFEGIWFWLFYGTYIAVAAWVMAEPLRYYGAARRRLRLGLAEPLVANRFLLWGSGSACRFVMLVAGATPPVLFRHIPPELFSDVTSLTLITVAFAGLGVSVTYWLTFFPSRAYVRFVTQRQLPAEG
jgi:hypothetical protein